MKLFPAFQIHTLELIVQRHYERSLAFHVDSLQNLSFHAKISSFHLCYGINNQEGSNNSLQEEAIIN